MNIKDAILDFPKQFSFAPVVTNGEKLLPTQKFLVVGMGGSNHATDLLLAWQPAKNVIVHRDYGLPELRDTSRLIIVCSYSGNTEEALDSYQVARQKQLPVAVITKGGALLDIAKRDAVPHIQLPDTGIEPRGAIGFMLVALLVLMRDDQSLVEVRALASILKPKNLQADGKAIAKQLKKFVPVVYSSRRNSALANMWKIIFNENVKMPIFANVFPELNHNEMNGFDPAAKTWTLMKKFRFVFLVDNSDDPRLQKRMVVLERLYRDRGHEVVMLPLVGQSRLERLFTAIILANWVSLALAKSYAVEPAPVPLVEEFKKLIK